MRIDQYSKRPGGLTGEEELVVVWGRVGNPGDIDYVEGTTWKGTLDEVIALYKASDESDPIFEAWLASDPIKPETNLVNVTNDTNNNILIGINTSNMTMFQSSGAYLTTADGYNILAVPGTTNAITGTVVFSNFNAISFGLNSGTMTASALGSLNFSDANGISWGGSIGTGASSASTTISVNSHGLRYTSADSQLRFTSADSQLRYTSADSQLQFTSANTKFAGTGTSATNASITLNSNGLQISVANPGAGGGIAASLGGNSTSAGAGYSNITSGTLLLAGGNNITLSQNGASVTISGANLGGAQTGISGVGVSNTTYTSGTVIYSAQNNITIGSSVDGASQYVQFSVGNYLTTAAASDHTHSNYINTSVSSAFRYTSADSQLQFTSANSNLLGSAATGSFVFTSQSSLFQHTSVTSAITASAMNTSERASLQYTSANTKFIQAWELEGAQTAGTTSSAQGTQLYLSGGNMITISGNSNTVVFSLNSASLLGTGATQSFRHTSADSQLQFTSANSNLLGSGATASLVFTSQSSLFQHTSATSAITSNAFNTSGSSNFLLTANSSLLQHTSATSAITSNAFNTSGSSNFLLTANSSLLQHTSATSAITSAAFPSANTTKFAGSGTTTASITGSVLKLTVDSVGVNLGVPAWVTNAAGGGAVLPGDYLSSSVNGVSTAISVTGLQATSATSAITSNAVNTSASSNFRFTSADSQLQFTSANSKFAQSWELKGAQTAGTTGSSQGSILYFSAGNMITLSGSSNTIVFSVNSASLLGTGATQSFRHTSVDSQLQFTSANSNLLGSGATASLVFTSQSSLFQHTSATSAITSAAFAASATTKFAGSGTSATNATITLNSNGLAISVAAPGAAAEANWINLQGNTASNSTASGSTIMWSAGNNITLAATNGSVIRIDAAAGGGGVAIAGSGASTVTNGTLVFSNANSVSFGLNGSTMTASVPIGTVAFSDANGITFGSSVNGVSTSISASWNSTHSHGNPTLALTNLTGTTASASNGFTLSLSAANSGGGAVYTDNEWHNFTGNSTHQAPGQNTIWYQPFELRNPVSASSLQIGMTFTGTVTSAVTAQFGMTQNFMIMSRNETNSTRFDSIWSTQNVFTMWNSGTTSGSWASMGSTSSSAASNILITQIMGQRIISAPIGSELSTGFYMMAYRQSTSSANYSALMRSYNPVFVAPLPMAKNFIGLQTATSVGHFIGGPYSVTSAAFPSTIGVSELRKSNDLRLFFKLGAVS